MECLFKKRTNYNLINIADFNSLIAQSQMNNTPVFELTQEQVEKTGSVWENMKRNRDDFSVTFETLAKTIIALTKLNKCGDTIDVSPLIFCEILLSLSS